MHPVFYIGMILDDILFFSDFFYLSAYSPVTWMVGSLMKK